MINLWCWLNNNSNSAAVQAIAGIGQMVAAIITLSVMIKLGRKQNEIARQQKDIAAYDKRNKLYMDLIQTLDEIRSLEINSSHSINEKYWQFSHEFYSLYYKFKNLSEEIPFLYNKEFSESLINKILNKIDEAHKSQIINMEKIDRCLSNGRESSTGEMLDHVAIVEEKQQYDRDIMELRSLLKEKFQEYLTLTGK